LKPGGRPCGVCRAPDRRPARRLEGLDDISGSSPDRIAICADCVDVGARSELKPGHSEDTLSGRFTGPNALEKVPPAPPTDITGQKQHHRSQRLRVVAP